MGNRKARSVKLLKTRELIETTIARADPVFCFITEPYRNNYPVGLPIAETFGILTEQWYQDETAVLGSKTRTADQMIQGVGCRHICTEISRELVAF